MTSAYTRGLGPIESCGMPAGEHFRLDVTQRVFTTTKNSIDEDFRNHL